MVRIEDATRVGSLTRRQLPVLGSARTIRHQRRSDGEDLAWPTA